jgi:hypothetical protein
MRSPKELRTCQLVRNQEMSAAGIFGGGVSRSRVTLVREGATRLSKLVPDSSLLNTIARVRTRGSVLIRNPNAIAPLHEQREVVSGSSFEEFESRSRGLGSASVDFDFAQQLRFAGGDAGGFAFRQQQLPVACRS